jgi:hypothetical protein
LQGCGFSLNDFIRAYLSNEKKSEFYEEKYPELKKLLGGTLFHTEPPIFKEIAYKMEAKVFDLRLAGIPTFSNRVGVAIKDINFIYDKSKLNCFSNAVFMITV